ncbi:TPA: hypothetical protein ACGG77_002260 [Vibrio cholerae]
MKRLMLSTLLMTTPFFTFAADDVFTSERWKEVKVNDPYLVELNGICSQKYPGSRSASLSDAFEFIKKFEEESARPRLYSFLRETSGFADISDPKVQSAFKLNGEYRTLSLPFVLDDPIGYDNLGVIFNIGKKKILNPDEYDRYGDYGPDGYQEYVEVFGVGIDGIELNKPNQIDLAPSLGEAKVFCIVGTENS